MMNDHTPLPRSRRSAAIWFLFCLLLLMLNPQASVSAESDESALPNGPFVMRVYYDDIADIDGLADYDLWEVNHLHEKYVLVSGTADTFDDLAAAGWQLSVDEEATAMINPPVWMQPFFEGYRTTAEIHADMLRIQAENPDITTVIDYGDSFCKLNAPCITPGGDAQPGQDLLAIRVTNKQTEGSSAVVDGALVPGTKPVFFLMSAIHSREITTPELSMRMLDWLVEGYGTDPDATWLVDWHEIWIVPVANPDGHWLVQLGEKAPYDTTPFYQRKNARQDNDGDGETDCPIWPPISGYHYGVDLNRNHSVGFGGSGSSPAVCAATYRGVGPASEPETAALQSLLTALYPDQRSNEPSDPAPTDTRGLFMTLHSYGELVLYPWSYVNEPAPNVTGLSGLAEKFASYNGYTACQPPVCLYTASGTTDDWVYGTLGIPSFTFEVGQAFMPPYSEVDALQWPANGPAFQDGARLAYQPYTQIQAPDVVGISAEIDDAGMLIVSAELDPSNTQSVGIGGATATIDQPYWLPDSAEIALAIELYEEDDGATASAEIDISNLAPGRHLLLAQGVSPNGETGAPRGIFFTVPDVARPNLVFAPMVVR